MFSSRTAVLMISRFASFPSKLSAEIWIGKQLAHTHTSVILSIDFRVSYFSGICVYYDVLEAELKHNGRKWIFVREGWKAEILQFLSRQPQNIDKASRRAENLLFRWFIKCPKCCQPQNSMENKTIFDWAAINVNWFGSSFSRLLRLRPTSLLSLFNLFIYRQHDRILFWWFDGSQFSWNSLSIYFPFQFRRWTQKKLAERLKFCKIDSSRDKKIKIRIQVQDFDSLTVSSIKTMVLIDKPHASAIKRFDCHSRMVQVCLQMEKKVFIFFHLPAAIFSLANNDRLSSRLPVVGFNWNYLNKPRSVSDFKFSLENICAAFAINSVEMFDTK